MNPIDTTLIDQIKRHEGFVPHVYKCSADTWTIGYGTAVDEKNGTGITMEEAEYLLINRLSKFIGELEKHPWFRNSPPGVQNALINMAYNLGIAGLLNFKKMIAALEAGDFIEASNQVMDSKYAKQVGGRAAELSSQIRQGQ